MHIIRSAPCFSSSHLPSYDLLLKSILSNITNIDFQNNVYCWLQATLPVNLGESESEVWFIFLPLPFWLELMDCSLLFIVSFHFGLVKLVLPSHSGVMTRVSLLHSRPSPTYRSRGTSLVFLQGQSLSYRILVTVRPELVSWRCLLVSQVLG